MTTVPLATSPGFMREALTIAPDLELLRSGLQLPGQTVGVGVGVAVGEGVGVGHRPLALPLPPPTLQGALLAATNSTTEELRVTP